MNRKVLEIAARCGAIIFNGGQHCLVCQQALDHAMSHDPDLRALIRSIVQPETSLPTYRDLPREDVEKEMRAADINEYIRSVLAGVTALGLTSDEWHGIQKRLRAVLTF